MRWGRGGGGTANLGKNEVKENNLYTIKSKRKFNRFLFHNRLSLTVLTCVTYELVVNSSLRRSLCKSLFGPRREIVWAWSTLLKYWFGRLRRPFPKGESNLWNFQIFIKISKKGLWPSVFLKSLTFSTILKKSCWNCDFENQRSTPQLEIKFSNP